jgi:hypothetical protein
MTSFEYNSIIFILLKATQLEGRPTPPGMRDHTLEGFLRGGEPIRFLEGDAV